MGEKANVSTRQRVHDSTNAESSNYLAIDETATSDDALMQPLPLRAESHTRSLVKGLTWRILATMTTVSIAYMVTGHVADAIRIGFVEFFCKLAIYYVHERVWARIPL